MNRLYRFMYLYLAALAGLLHPRECAAGNTAEAIAVLRGASPEGRGNQQATGAWAELAAGGGETMMAALGGMQGANPLALNWLRSVVDTIAARLRQSGQELPLQELRDFARRTTHHPRARRLAFELIAQADAEAADELLSGMLDDPSTELRREAVARVMDEAGRAQGGEALERYERALRAARDVDQIEAIAKALREHGREVKLGDVFGWITVWRVIGPFDSTEGAGFDRVFPPELAVDFSDEHMGKTGPVRWQEVSVSSDYGLVDLNKPLGMLKEVAGYAAAEVDSPVAQRVEIRLGCKNAWKVWCNGRFLFGRDEYHRGIEIDQYRLGADLVPGKNLILVKVCQNAQMEDWTKEWEFQLRITDELGTPIRFSKKD